MRLAILQPSYLPWLGFFDQMHRSDQFVLFDDVQFTRRDWRNRNRIRVREGSAWLTVPVIQKNKYEQSLLETKIDNSTLWRHKHLETIRCHYSKTPYFELYFPWCEQIYNNEWKFLLDLSLETIHFLKEQLKIDTPLLLSSQLETPVNKTERLIAICKQLGATHYLSGDSARNYISGEEFSNLHEYLDGTDPTNGDTDGDGMSDGWEVYWGFQPKNSSDSLLDVDNDDLQFTVNPTREDIALIN